MSDACEVQVGPEGRVLIPAAVRQQVGIGPGSILTLRVEGERVILVPRTAVKRRLREMFAGVQESMAEELIASRRVDVERELQS